MELIQTRLRSTTGRVGVNPIDGEFQPQAISIERSFTTQALSNNRPRTMIVIRTPVEWLSIISNKCIGSSMAAANPIRRSTHYIESKAAENLRLNVKTY